MENSAVWNVLKWVLAALAAGFIGQFGRSLALRIIERRRRRTATQEGTQVLIPPRMMWPSRRSKAEN